MAFRDSHLLVFVDRVDLTPDPTADRADPGAHMVEKLKPSTNSQNPEKEVTQHGTFPRALILHYAHPRRQGLQNWSEILRRDLSEGRPFYSPAKESQRRDPSEASSPSPSPPEHPSELPDRRIYRTHPLRGRCHQHFTNRDTATALWGPPSCRPRDQARRGLESQPNDRIPVIEFPASGLFESHDLLPQDFPCVKNELLPGYPLEWPEKTFQPNQDKMNFSTLRNIQRPFVPLKLQMEFEAAQAQHLPVPPSSNLSPDIMRGNNQMTGFEDMEVQIQEDILNDLSQSELLEEPHLMVGDKLGRL
ncbi:PREDICTED: LOW QUALITY PROTEIN: uncharacterized protein LOC104979890 [Bison bison bison]|uniref:LOW QUALITY PROTEIN: uncharacterized protein LOC104979890 n=1 Tax=Bison bison bison TaxID=43346 RepID=A0A6P3G4P6_BISBB|nr:PREDICTED: LOW QUALITY PROTEIN: uncharacterized protein LOC104979890 [Bison bison bison]